MDSSMEDLLKAVEEEQKEKEKKPEQPQFTEAQTKALLAELSPKLREELCQVLRAQQQNVPLEERPPMSTELCRILQRFHRRAGFGRDGRRLQDPGEEIWPMYLGIALFIILSVLFGFLWLQEQYAEEDMSDHDDFYWQVK